MAKKKEKKAGRRMKKKELANILMDFFHTKQEEVISLKYLFAELHLTTQPMKKLCKEMKVEIIEGEACPDHIHLLVSIAPYMSMAQFVGTLKSKSALMIFDRHANLKYKYGSRNFWCRGYFADKVGKKAKMILE